MRRIIVLLTTALLLLVGLYYTLRITPDELTAENSLTPIKSLATNTPHGIVFVTIDTLRADQLTPYGYLRENAPFLRKLSDGGITFEKAFTACSHTAPSHTSMFTSLYPFEHGVLRNHETLAPSFVTLEQLMEKAGYETAAFPAVTFMDGKVGFRELPKELDIPEAKVSEKHWYRNAGTQVSRVLNWFKNRKDPSKPFFVWLHFYDVHQWKGRGQLPAEYWEMMKPEDPAALTKFLYEQRNIPKDFFKNEAQLIKAFHGYDARLRYVDAELERLDQGLKQQIKGGPTLWVVTSDHGEGLGNHHYEGHGEHIYNEQLHIPLIFYLDQNGGFTTSLKNKKIPNLVRTVDLLPTLVDLVRSDPLPSSIPLRGNSLVSFLRGELEPELAYLQGFAQRRPKDQSKLREKWEEGMVQSVFDLEHKFIHHSKGAHEYYHLEKDPFEIENLYTSDQTGMVKELEQELITLREGRMESDREGAKVEQELSKEMIEELKALGYL